MGCCGRRIDRSPTRVRDEPVEPRSTAAAVASATIAAPVRAAAPPARPWFRYTGPSSLRVVGPRTGRVYVFGYHGEELAVDPRDAPFLAAVPRLVRTRHPPV